MTQLHIVCSLTAFALAIMGCTSSSNDGVSPQYRDSLVVLETSFEANGSPTLDGWTPTDIVLVRFSTDVPPGGGAYSLEILGLQGRANWVVTSIPAAPGANHIRTSFWARKAGDAVPHVYVGLKRGEGVISAHGISIADTVWTSYSLLDTLAATQGDSLYIKIDGGSGQSWDGASFYDLVTLRRYY